MKKKVHILTSTSLAIVVSAMSLQAGAEKESEKSGEAVTAESVIAKFQEASVTEFSPKEFLKSRRYGLKGGQEVKKDSPEEASESKNVSETNSFMSSLRESGSKYVAEEESRRDQGWVWRYLFSMAAVVALMGGVLFVLRKFRFGLTRGTAAEKGVRILGKFPLDKHNHLIMIRIKDEDLLLASGSDGVKILSRYPQDSSEVTRGGSFGDEVYSAYSDNADRPDAHIPSS